MALRVITITLLLGLAAAAASAQTAGNPFGVGTTLSGFGGGTVDRDGVAPAAGLALGWEVTPHLAIEGTTLWSLPGDGQHDFGVMIGPKVSLTHGRPAVPFLSFAVGMYRASFDSLGGPLPTFYGRRVSAADRTNREGSFDDFLAAIGGGAEFFLRDHWSLRPDARLLLVAGDSRTRWVTAFGAHLAYHFERHRITD